MRRWVGYIVQTVPALHQVRLRGVFLTVGKARPDHYFRIAGLMLFGYGFHLDLMAS
ncbi:hypothetical protein [Paractinoplanes rishiriensis]|uniref:Uncharacterized protein n=1 Tax=Paractinoplanes rishiriensis TaxID=1050105 RepID=A0A919MY23_9ACTN|nr:hypothetical protein [Actinoplanes rishiriensis]GIE99339.1 hypothetical protein Ari01nite_68040 [Actinoplanes rishiriensis]